MTRMPAQQVPVDDITLAYRECGNGYPVVFISGFASTMDMWNPPVLSAIAGHYRVIVFDNRGMGYSGSSGRPYSIPQFARDTALLMDALGITSAHILGHSMGASIARELALAHPERVNGLVLVSGECRHDGPPVRPEILAQLTDKRGTMQEVAGRMFSLLFPPAWLSAHDPWQYCPEVDEPITEENVARQARAFLSWNGSYDRLGEIRSPALIVTGMDDVVIPPGNSRILHAQIPGAELVEIPGAGHGLMYQEPDRFSEYVLDFLGRITP
jgi:pimeloyl-ACP methyl ester carboxylesterase